MTLRATCGLVLKIAEHGEADKLVTLYSQDLGRVTGIAKGAKRSRQRFVNKLEEFSHLQIWYRPPRGPTGLLLIGEAELLRAHLSLRTSYERYVTAMYIGELLLRFTRENDPDPRLFALLHWALASLDNQDNPQKIAALYHLQLLTAVGYRPELQHCSLCRHPVGPDRSFLFVPGNGSILCSACHHQHGPHYNRLSVQTLKFLAGGQQVPLGRLGRLQLTGQAAAQALEALHHYSCHLLQQDVHSWQAMHTLSTAPPAGRDRVGNDSRRRPQPGALAGNPLEI